MMGANVRFAAHSSLEQPPANGRIPFPSAQEKAPDGQARVAVGTDNKLGISPEHGRAAAGALLICRSGGESWREKEYGRLPCDQVLRRLAEDFWSALKKA